MSSGTEWKKLSDLRVVDLKNELEKLGLEKNGIKAVLIERLQKVIMNVFNRNIVDMASVYSVLSFK